MLKGLNSLSESFLTDLQRINERQARVQSQITSGLAVQRASDAPEKIVDILRVNSLVRHNEQIDANLTNATTEVNSAETALSQAVELLERANTLAVQTTGNNPEAKRNFAAVEIKGLHDQLVSLTRTSVQGQLVFSGDLDQTVLYTTDWTKPGGVARPLDSSGNPITASNTRKIEDVMGARFSIGKSAHQIFDTRTSGGTPATDNAFQAVYELGQALEADDGDAVAATLPKLQAALDHLNGQFAFYGDAKNRIGAASDAAKQQHINLSKQLSDWQDTDIAAAVLELNQAGVHQQAALAAHSRLPKTSLFDYLA